MLQIMVGSKGQQIGIAGVDGLIPGGEWTDVTEDQRKAFEEVNGHTMEEDFGIQTRAKPTTKPKPAAKKAPAKRKGA